MKWTQLQDALLIDAAHRHSKTWITVAKSVPGKRSDVECRERFNYLESKGMAIPFPKSPAVRRIQSPAKPRKSPTKNRQYIKRSGVQSSPVRITRAASSKIPPPNVSKSSWRNPSPLKSRTNTNHFDKPGKTHLINKSPTKMNWTVKKIQPLPLNFNEISPLNQPPAGPNNTHEPHSSPVFAKSRDSPFKNCTNNQLTPYKNADTADLFDLNIPETNTLLDTIGTYNKEIAFDDLFNFDMFNDELGQTSSMAVNEEISSPNFMKAPENDKLDVFPNQLDSTSSILLEDSMLPQINTFQLNPTSSDRSFLESLFSDDLQPNHDTSQNILPCLFSNNHQNLPVQNILPDSYVPYIFPEPEPTQINNPKPDLDITRDEVEDLFKDSVDDNNQYCDLSKKAKSYNWVTNSSGGFTVEQLDELKSQLSQSLQLVIQGFVIEKELNNPRDTFWEDQLNSIIRARDIGMSVTGSNSFFNIKGLERMKQFELGASNSGFSKRYYDHNKKKGSIPHSQNIKKTLQFFSDVFTPELIPKILPVNPSKAMFSQFEDTLLFHGIQQYGENDIPSIRSHYLPARTCSQIKLRLHSITKRSRSPSILKNFYLLPFKPLNVNEKFILKSGVQKYGSNFKLFLPITFPHIPGPLIEVAWNELYRIGSILIPSNCIITAKSGKELITPSQRFGGRKKKIPNSISSGNIKSTIVRHSANQNTTMKPTAAILTSDPISSPIRSNSNSRDKFKLSHIPSWNSDFDTDLENVSHHQPVSNSILPQHNANINGRPKISFTGAYNMSDSEEDQNSKEPDAKMSPLLSTDDIRPPERQIKGIGRGALNRKRRLRNNRDLINISEPRKVEQLCLF
ncbi:hypothetical protein BC833DRAFT_583875 [Globomyces pollinis-pini]|nr:hypothetical protein BC833DRAFT_583875 [Globomyces pollinis-pini]